MLFFAGVFAFSAALPTDCFRLADILGKFAEGSAKVEDDGVSGCAWDFVWAGGWGWVWRWGCCVAVKSGVREVSSGKVLLHVILLAKKKFSLAGGSQPPHTTNVIRTRQATGCAGLATAPDRWCIARRHGSAAGRRCRSPARAADEAPAPRLSPEGAKEAYRAVAELLRRPRSVGKGVP